MTWKPLKLFVYTLSTDGKYSLLSGDNLMQPIQMHLSQKQKEILDLFVHFSNLHQISNIITKK